MNKVILHHRINESHGAVKGCFNLWLSFEMENHIMNNPMFGALRQNFSLSK